MGGLCPGGSLSMGGLCPGGACPGRCLCMGGSLSRGVSVNGGEVSVQGISVQAGGSLSRQGVSVTETSPTLRWNSGRYASHWNPFLLMTW